MFKIPKQRSSVVKTFTYKGFKVEILDNAYYSFRYEWRLTAISRNTRRICEANYKPQYKKDKYVFYDPTSMPSIEYTIIHAKEMVNELSYPMYYKLMNMRSYW